MVLELVADDELAERSMALAEHIAMVPANQLEMITWALNAVADHQYDPAAFAFGWAPCSTASRDTVRRASTSWPDRRRLDFAKRSASTTAPSATMANAAPEPSVAERRPDEIGPDADRRAPVRLVRAD